MSSRHRRPRRSPQSSSSTHVVRVSKRHLQLIPRHHDSDSDSDSPDDDSNRTQRTQLDDSDRFLMPGFGRFKSPNRPGFDVSFSELSDIELQEVLGSLPFKRAATDHSGGAPSAFAAAHRRRNKVKFRGRDRDRGRGQRRRRGRRRRGRGHGDNMSPTTSQWNCWGEGGIRDEDLSLSSSPSSSSSPSPSSSPSSEPISSQLSLDNFSEEIFCADDPLAGKMKELSRLRKSRSDIVVPDRRSRNRSRYGVVGAGSLSSLTNPNSRGSMIGSRRRSRGRTCVGVGGIPRSATTHQFRLPQVVGSRSRRRSPTSLSPSPSSQRFGQTSSTSPGSGIGSGVGGGSAGLSIHDITLAGGPGADRGGHRKNHSSLRGLFKGGGIGEIGGRTRSRSRSVIGLRSPNLNLQDGSGEGTKSHPLNPIDMASLSRFGRRKVSAQRKDKKEIRIRARTRSHTIVNRNSVRTQHAAASSSSLSSSPTSSSSSPWASHLGSLLPSRCAPSTKKLRSEDTTTTHSPSSGGSSISVSVSFGVRAQSLAEAGPEEDDPEAEAAARAVMDSLLERNRQERERQSKSRIQIAEKEPEKATAGARAGAAAAAAAGPAAGAAFARTPVRNTEIPVSVSVSEAKEEEIPLSVDVNVDLCDVEDEQEEEKAAPTKEDSIANLLKRSATVSFIETDRVALRRIMEESRGPQTARLRGGLGPGRPGAKLPGGVVRVRDRFNEGSESLSGGGIDESAEEGADQHFFLPSIGIGQSLYQTPTIEVLYAEKDSPATPKSSSSTRQFRTGLGASLLPSAALIRIIAFVAADWASLFSLMKVCSRFRVVFVSVIPSLISDEEFDSARLLPWVVVSTERQKKTLGIGMTSEAYLMSQERRRRVFQRIQEQNAGSVPLRIPYVTRILFEGVSPNRVKKYLTVFPNARGVQIRTRGLKSNLEMQEIENVEWCLFDVRKSLQVLVLDGCYDDQKGTNAALLLREFPNLTRLKFTRVRRPGEIPESVATFERMKTQEDALVLDAVQLTGPYDIESETLMSLYPRFSNLDRLGLERFHLTLKGDDEDAVFPVSILPMFMRHLNLSRTRIGRTGFLRILKSVPSLRVLNVMDCDISFRRGAADPARQTYRTLHHLGIRRNNIKTSGLIQLFRIFPALRSIDFVGNDFAGQDEFLRGIRSCKPVFLKRMIYDSQSGLLPISFHLLLKHLPRLHHLVVVVPVLTYHSQKQERTSLSLLFPSDCPVRVLEFLEDTTEIPDEEDGVPKAAIISGATFLDRDTLICVFHKLRSLRKVVFRHVEMSPADLSVASVFSFRHHKIDHHDDSPRDLSSYSRSQQESIRKSQELTPRLHELRGSPRNVGRRSYSPSSAADSPRSIGSDDGERKQWTPRLVELRDSPRDRSLSPKRQDSPVSQDPSSRPKFGRMESVHLQRSPKSNSGSPNIEKVKDRFRMHRQDSFGLSLSHEIVRLCPLQSISLGHSGSLFEWDHLVMICNMCPSLERIHIAPRGLVCNVRSDEGLYRLVTHRALREVIFERNDIGAGPFLTFPEIAVGLEKFHVAGCGLRAEEVVELHTRRLRAKRGSEEDLINSSLRYLSLSDNELTLDSLAVVLKRYPGLETLILDDCNLHGEALVSRLRGVYPKLRSLRARFNYCFDEKTVQTILTAFPNLLELDLLGSMGTRSGLRLDFRRIRKMIREATPNLKFWRGALL